MEGIIKRVSSEHISPNDFVEANGGIAKVLSVESDKAVVKGLIGDINGKTITLPVSELHVFVIHFMGSDVRISNYDYYHIFFKKLVNKQVSFNISYLKIQRKGYLQKLEIANLIR